MQKRRRFKQTEPLPDRLQVFAQLLRERAGFMPDGRERSDALAKADQADATATLERWLSSPELQPPK